MYYENKNGYLYSKQLAEMSNTHHRSIRSYTKVYRIMKHTLLSTAIKHSL